MNRNRMKLINRIAYIVFLMFYVCFMASGLMFSSVDKMTPSDRNTIEKVKPESSRYVGDKAVEYHIKLTASAYDNMALIFVSRHQEVEVYAGGKLIYYVKAHKSVYGTTTGTNYSVVNIPSYTTDVVVKLTNVYDGFKIRETTFQYGDDTTIVRNLIRNSLPSAVLSAFIILIGAGMVLLWIICRKRITQTNSLLYFGIFAMIIGTWALNETDLATILLEDRKIASLIGYVLLMMIPIPFVEAEHSFFHVRKSSVSNILCVIFAVTDIFLVVCHMTGIKEFKYTARIIHLMLVMSFIYFCGVVVMRIKERGFDRKVKNNIIAVIALGVSMIVDLIAYYKGLQQTDVLGSIGILVFIIVLAAESISEAFEKIKEGQKADFYKEMAITDAMTGLYNRTAFEEWEKETSDYNGYAIATFDLNNLKLCNDNYGHAAGDTYIEAAAHTIKDIFGKHGKCYRIGGDEFCAVINKKEKPFEIGKHVKQLRDIEKIVEQELAIKGLKVRIACGYAEYNSETDDNFEDTRSRADKRMYESKKQLKSE